MPSLSGTCFFLTLFRRCATIRPSSRKCFEDYRERLKSWAARSVSLYEAAKGCSQVSQRRFAAFCFQAYAQQPSGLMFAC